MAKPIWANAGSGVTVTTNEGVTITANRNSAVGLLMVEAAKRGYSITWSRGPAAVAANGWNDIAPIAATGPSGAIGTDTNALNWAIAVIPEDSYNPSTRTFNWADAYAIVGWNPNMALRDSQAVELTNLNGQAAVARALPAGYADAAPGDWLNPADVGPLAFCAGWDANDRGFWLVLVHRAGGPMFVAAGNQFLAQAPDQYIAVYVREQLARMRVYVSPDGWDSTTTAYTFPATGPVVIWDNNPQVFGTQGIAQNAALAPFAHVGGFGETSTSVFRFPDSTAANPAPATIAMNRAILKGPHSLVVAMPGSGYNDWAGAVTAKGAGKSTRVNVRMTMV